MNARVTPVRRREPGDRHRRVRGLGYTHARFGDGSASSGLQVEGNRLPNAPELTANAGAQLSRAVGGPITLYGRAEAVFTGSYFYDDANTTEQDAYALTNFRAGARGRFVFAEAWIRNAFDTRYIPVAFPLRSRRRDSSARWAGPNVRDQSRRDVLNLHLEGGRAFTARRALIIDRQKQGRWMRQGAGCPVAAPVRERRSPAAHLVREPRSVRAWLHRIEQSRSRSARSGAALRR